MDTLVAVLAIIRFYGRMKPELQHHHALLKMVCFKGLVILTIIPTTLFTSLANYKVFFPTTHISFLDFEVGIPDLIACFLMFVFSISFWWGFSSAPYRQAASNGAKKATLGRAIMDVVNISDILAGIIFMFKAMNPGSFGKRYINEGKASYEDDSEQSQSQSAPAPVPAPASAPTQAPAPAHTGEYHYRMENV